MYDFEHMDKRLIIYANTFLVANRLQAVMDGELEEITSKQWLAIIMLGAFEEPPTLKQMAQMCSTSHQNMKQIMLKLHQKGYVEIAKDKKDGRVMRIIPLPKMQEINIKYDERSKKFIEEMFSDLSEEEIAIMCKAQFKIYDRLEQISKESSKR